MPYALTTIGQGSTSYIQSSATFGGASTVAFEFGGRFEVESLAANTDLGRSQSSSLHVLRVDTAGRLVLFQSGERIASAAGSIAAGVPFEWKVVNNLTTGNWELYLNNMVTPVGTFARTTLSFTLNQLPRSNSANTYGFKVYSLWQTVGSFVDRWDETTAPNTGKVWTSTGGTRTLTCTNFAGAADSWWVFYNSITNSNQHQTSGASALQQCSGVANTSIVNSQHHITSTTATQAFNVIASTVQVNGQRTTSAAGASQLSMAVAGAEPLNNQNHQANGTGEQITTGTAQASAVAINNQHRNSAGQLLSVAGFIANTSWVNTVDLGNIQHRGTSGSTTQAASTAVTTSALNSQQRQSSGTAEHAANGNADTTASNSQHRQSAAELRSVAGFIASTSWVNTVDLGNIQHRGTSGSTTLAASAAATTTAINSQNRQSSAHGTAEFTAMASTSRVNTILQKAVYIRRIETQSITKKVYRTASRHKIGLKTQSGGGYMQELNFKQGASALLQIEHTIDNEPVSGISEAKYELYGRTGQVLVTKTLGEGIEFSAGLIEIELTENDTATLSSSYTHQCVARDLAGLKFYPLKGDITFGATKPRL